MAKTHRRRSTLLGGSATGASDSVGGSSNTPKTGGNLTFLIQEFPTGWVSSESNISSYEGNLWGEITDAATATGGAAPGPGQAAR